MDEQSFERLEAPLKSDLPERVEMKVRRERRRRWTAEDKVRIVREMLEPGAVALRVAERHEISTGLLFTWRRQMMAHVAPEFMPVQIEAASPLPPPASSPSSLTDGLIEIELPGGARVRAGRGADVKLLRGILTALDGR